MFLLGKNIFLIYDNFAKYISVDESETAQASAKSTYTGGLLIKQLATEGDSRK